MIAFQNLIKLSPFLFSPLTSTLRNRNLLTHYYYLFRYYYTIILWRRRTWANFKFKRYDFKIGWNYLLIFFFCYISFQKRGKEYLNPINLISLRLLRLNPVIKINNTIFFILENDIFVSKMIYIYIHGRTIHRSKNDEHFGLTLFDASKNNTQSMWILCITMAVTESVAQSPIFKRFLFHYPWQLSATTDLTIILV